MQGHNCFFQWSEKQYKQRSAGLSQSISKLMGTCLGIRPHICVMSLRNCPVRSSGRTKDQTSHVNLDFVTSIKQMTTSARFTLVIALIALDSMMPKVISTSAFRLLLTGPSLEVCASLATACLRFPMRFPQGPLPLLSTRSVAFKYRHHRVLCRVSNV